MMPLPPLLGRTLRWAPFVVSAALVAAFLHVGFREPWLLAVVGCIAALLWAQHLKARRDVLRLLSSGDVDAIAAAWGDAVAHGPFPETVGPLLAATTLVANGYTERARRALDRVVRGPAWDAALDQRLVVETLLEALDGDRARALRRAAELGALPLPEAGPLVRARVKELRRALAALARAFARACHPDDAQVLHGAARQHPLVFWPLRYAAAIAWLEQGRPERALRELAGAPAWPEESALRAVHQELYQVASRRLAGRT